MFFAQFFEVDGGVDLCNLTVHQTLQVYKNIQGLVTGPNAGDEAFPSPTEYAHCGRSGDKTLREGGSLPSFPQLKLTTTQPRLAHVTFCVHNASNGPGTSFVKAGVFAY